MSIYSKYFGNSTGGGGGGSGPITPSYINLPATGADGVTGTIQQVGTPVFQTYGVGPSGNLFISPPQEGVGAGNFTNTGDGNIGLGGLALISLTTGNNNFAAGMVNFQGPLQVLTSGSNNIGILGQALQALQTGSDNIGLGMGALAALVSGSGNIGIGPGTLFAVEGSNNVAIGSLNVGDGATSLENCTLLGAGAAISNGVSNSIAIGYQANATVNNSCEIGNSSLAFVHTAGQVRCASLGVGNSAAATLPGTVTKKMEVFDASGTSLGFIAIYDSIT